MSKKNVATLVRENRTAFIIIAIALFLIELEIFAIAAMQSGKKSRLQVFDQSGQLIHEEEGASLSDFNRYYFEKTFGPFEKYLENNQVRRITREVPFPFRAWFVAAVGIPVGVILLFAFVVQAYITLFYGRLHDQQSRASTDESTDETESRAYRSGVERILHTISSFNIFTIGFLIFLGVFAYWVIPETVKYMGRIGAETLNRYKWVFIATGVTVVGLFVWVVYLRYLLAKQSINNQAELEKVRLQLHYQQEGEVPPLQLDYGPRKGDKKTPLVGWDKSDEGPKGGNESLIDIPPQSDSKV